MDLSFQLKSLSLSNNDDDTMVIYLSQLGGKENINFYKLLWSAVLMRNCDESGRFGVLANQTLFTKLSKLLRFLIGKENNIIDKNINDI